MHRTPKIMSRLLSYCTVLLNFNTAPTEPGLYCSKQVHCLFIIPGQTCNNSCEPIISIISRLPCIMMYGVCFCQGGSEKGYALYACGKWRQLWMTPKDIFNVHWPNSLGLIEGLCTVCEQPWVDFNPRPFAHKATTLTTAPRRQYYFLKF